MKLLATWLRDFVDLKVDNDTLAHDLTSIGIAVEGISGERDSTVFEMEIGTNRPDAMNHYGVAREASALYDLPLRAFVPNSLPLPASAVSPSRWKTGATVPGSRRASYVASASRLRRQKSPTDWHY